MPADRAALVARLRREAHNLDAAYRAPEDGPSWVAELLLEAADALTAPPEAHDCRDAVRAALLEVREAVQRVEEMPGAPSSAVQWYLDHDPAEACRAAVRAIKREVAQAIDAKLADLERQTTREGPC